MANLNIANEIARALSEYTNEVKEGVEKAQLEVAKETVQDLKETSPKLTGDYQKGWTRKKVGTAEVVHNKTNYQLTHLLEKGHAKRGGGRVPAYPHIGRAEDRAVREYIERVERVIRG
jgi:hypothetical protein